MQGPWRGSMHFAGSMQGPCRMMRGPANGADRPGPHTHYQQQQQQCCPMHQHLPDLTLTGAACTMDQHARHGAWHDQHEHARHAAATRCSMQQMMNHHQIMACRHLSHLPIQMMRLVMRMRMRMRIEAWRYLWEYLCRLSIFGILFDKQIGAILSILLTHFMVPLPCNSCFDDAEMRLSWKTFAYVAYPDHLGQGSNPPQPHRSGKEFGAGWWLHVGWWQWLAIWSSFSNSVRCNGYNCIVCVQ